MTVRTVSARRVASRGQERTFAEDFPGLQLGVRAFARSAEPGVRGVDGLLVGRQPPTALAGVGIARWTAVRDFDIRARAAIGAVADHPHPSFLECVEQAVFAGRAHVMPSTRQSR